MQNIQLRFVLSLGNNIGTALQNLIQFYSVIISKFLNMFGGGLAVSSSIFEFLPGTICAFV
jgi:hypothetical protein